jgi:hypothetical protein
MSDEQTPAIIGIIETSCNNLTLLTNLSLLCDEIQLGDTPDDGK